MADRRSEAQALGSWARTPLEAWMSVHVCSELVLVCVGSGLASALSPAQGVLPTLHKIYRFRVNSEWKPAR
jgi:hypothetical protein